jgi:hypothetical protein
MAYFFWFLGAVVFLIGDERFRYFGVSSGMQTALFFGLVIAGMICNLGRAAKAFDAMIHPIKALRLGFGRREEPQNEAKQPDQHDD